LEIVKKEHNKMTEIVKKRIWDKIIIGIGVVTGFSIVMMKLTGYWPCDIINAIAHSYLC